MLENEEIDIEMKEVFDSVHNAFEISKKEGLEVEVFSFALLILKDNPQISIVEALEHGIGEWIK